MAPTIFSKIKKRDGKPGILDNGFQPGKFYFALDILKDKAFKNYSLCDLDSVDLQLGSDGHYYELLDYEKPVYFKHDIDDKTQTDIEEVVNEAQGFLREVLLEIGWRQEPQFMVAYTPNDQKTSLHIKIRNLVFKNQKDYIEFQNYCIARGNKYWDKNDFGKHNQLVRCLNQSKIGKEPLQPYNDYFTPSDFLMQCHDISGITFFECEWAQKFKNIIGRLYPNVPDKIRQKINQEGADREYFTVIGQWKKKLVEDDYPKPNYHRGDPVAFLMDCIPNPNREGATCPYVLWNRIACILATMAEINGQDYENFFINFSQKCRGVFGDQRQVAIELYNKYVNGHKDQLGLQSLVQIVELVRFDLQKPLNLYSGLTNDIMFDKLVPNEIQSEKRFSDYGIDLSKGPVQVIEAPMSSGKSTATRACIVSHFNDGTYYIPMITPRISLSLDMYSMLQNEPFLFKHYQEDRNAFAQSDRYICQINSLCKVKQDRFVDKKIALFLDEIESLLSMINWKPPSDKSNRMGVSIDNLILMVQKAQYVFLMDAFITQRTIDFIKYVRGEYYFIRNVFQVHKRTLHFMRHGFNKVQKEKHLCECYGFVVSQLYQGKKVFFVAENANVVKQLCNEVEKMFGEQSYLCYQKRYPDRDDEEWISELKNVSESWSDKKLVATNATITVGVNFDQECFDLCVVYSTCMSSCVRNTIQSHCRIRQLKSNNVYLFLHTPYIKDYCSPFHIPKSIERFASYNNIVKQGSQLKHQVLHSANVWSMYEQQMNDIFRRDMLKMYFQDKCGYSWEDNLDQPIQGIDFSYICNWDRLKDWIELEYVMSQYYANKIGEDKLEQVLPNGGLESYERDREILRQCIIMNRAVKHQKDHWEAIQYINEFGKYLREDLTVDQAIEFYRLIIIIPKHKTFMQRYIKCINPSKPLSEQNNNDNVKCEQQIEFLRYFILQSEGLTQEFHTEKFIVWYQNYYSQFKTIQKLFGRNNFRADKTTIFSKDLVAKLNKLMTLLFDLEFQQDTEFKEERKKTYHGQYVERTFQFQLASRDFDMNNMYRYIIKPSEFKENSGSDNRYYEICNTLFGEYFGR